MTVPSCKRSLGGALPHRLLSGTAAVILGGSVLAGTAASAHPDLEVSGPVVTEQSAEVTPDVTPSVSIGQIGVSEEAPQTLEQIFDLLERAERVAHEEGRTMTPAVSQAAAELGMLLSTYLAQQSPAADDLGPTDPAPVEADTPAGADTPADADAAALTVDPAAAAPEHSTVTFDDVLLTAMRLATLLDSEGVYRVSVTVVADDAVTDTPLTQMLREAVGRYGQSTAGYANGRIPDEALCALPFAPGHRLRCDAAAQLVALNSAYQARFGRSIPITDSYRSLASQIAVRAAKPTLAAVPGTSQHGWGLAVDLGRPISSGTSAEYLWLRLNAPDYGWDNPSWARLTGSKPEPWHFEFFAAGPMPQRALSEQDVALFRSATSGSTPTPEPEPSASATPEPSASATPEPSASATPLPPAEPTPAPPTVSPSPSPSPTPEAPTTGPGDASPSPSPSPSPSADPTADPSASPSADPSTSPSPDPEPVASDPASAAPDPAPEPGPTPDPSTAPEPSPSEPSPTDLSPTEPAPDPPSDSGAALAVVPGRLSDGTPEHAGTGPGA